MNGVRRFLAGGGNTATSDDQQQPLASPPPQFSRTQGPTWPPEDVQQPPSQAPFSSPPKTSTAALFLRKDKQRQQSMDRVLRSSSHSRHSSKSSESYSNGFPPTSQPPPPPVPTKSLHTSSASINGYANKRRMPSVDTNGRPPSGTINIRDELLVSLLASEAVVESKDYRILTSEETEELKKEQQTLSPKLDGLTRKLATETKLRDAALSLSRAGISTKSTGPSPKEQLDAANKRVDAAQNELNALSSRFNDVSRRLLEHRAGVLSLSVRNMENKSSHTDSGYNTPSLAAMSPTNSSMTGVSASPRPRFDGLHLFAGHADAVAPRRKVSEAEVVELEQKLKAASDALSAASKKQAQLSRELAMMRLEKEEAEVSLSMELQSAQDTIQRLEQRNTQSSVDDNDLRAQLQAKDDEISQLQEEWESQRIAMEDEKLEDMTRLQEEQDRLREETQASLVNTKAELEEGVAVMQDIVEAHEIRVYGRDTTFGGLATAVAQYLDGVKGKFDAFAKAEQEWSQTRSRLEEEVRNGMDKREALLRDIETRARSGSIDSDLRVPVVPAPIDVSSLPSDVGQIIQVLQPVWHQLPSPEARAAKFSGGSKLRTGSPVPASPGGGQVGAKSLSELDVRSLKALYDQRPSFPPSPNLSSFSIEAFANRVQAVIADDRALIERLVRFAQAHDLLKKNAERAQKLAQEANNALETYQKQVRTLEERNMSANARYTAAQEEVHQLQEVVDRITREKDEIEAEAAAQAEACQQLSEANDTLSAKTLALAEEAASAPDKLKKQLDETKAALDDAQAEIDAMRMSEQSQKVALLDELNSLQNDNGKLREQLRALKR